MLIFSHRGYSGSYAENTMLAFEKAYEAGTDGIELDVQMTSDGTVVIFHDETLKRVCNLDKYVKDMHYEDLPLTADGLHHIPTLSQYLEWARDKDFTTNIEIKSSVIFYPGMEEKVGYLIRKYRLDEQVLISSFNPLSLLRMRDYAPHLPLGFLVGEYGMSGFDHLCSTYGFEYFHPDISIVTPELVESFHHRGIHVNTYTVNNEKEFLKAQKAGVDGIFTNIPETMKAIADQAATA